MKLELPMQWFADEQVAGEAIERELKTQLAEAGRDPQPRLEGDGADAGAECVPVSAREDLRGPGHAAAARSRGAGADRGTDCGDRAAGGVTGEAPRGEAALVRGERGVVFPAGTYWMVKHHGARVEPSR